MVEVYFPAGHLAVHDFVFKATEDPYRPSGQGSHWPTSVSPSLSPYLPKGLRITCHAEIDIYIREHVFFFHVIKYRLCRRQSYLPWACTG